MLNNSRRTFLGKLLKGAAISTTVPSGLAAADPWHLQIAQRAKALDTRKKLQVLIPNGSGPNINAAVTQFTRLSGVQCVIEEVAVDAINVELILRAAAGETSVDLALPATFGLTDLVQANAIMALDDLALRYEPAGFSDDFLYRSGDHYLDKLYGYQTDGDAYLLFYNKRMLEDADEQQAFEKVTGRELKPAESWEELDQMMAFFHRPAQNQFGGSLFRNPAYLVWEWWARFHAKGYLPFTNEMRANINNDAGVSALEELIRATDSLTIGSRSNGLFDNWADFARGNVFCNIGWGGTQKFLRANATMRDNLVHTPLPGPKRQGEATSLGYFNWGWSYAVSAGSQQTELAYLLALFCSTPAISTLAVRADGFFDPYQTLHYEDDGIKQAYGESFLTAHRQSLNVCIPDLYLSGQSNYLDILRQQILHTVNGEQTAQESMDICAQRWSHVTRRLGESSQKKQWEQLQKNYPDSFFDALQGQ